MTAPETQITGGPTRSPTGNTTAYVFFRAFEEGSTFGCSLDGRPFVVCSSPVIYEDLAHGLHYVRVRATDRAGNRDRTPASLGWVVDRIAPETQIDSGPPALTTETAATFIFSTSSVDVGGFMCALDDALFFSSCRPPLRLTDLAEGAHRLRVRARDAASNEDATPSVYEWRVDVPPDTRIDQAPPPDADADLVPDASDNCPEDVNAEQADRDADFIGDACETLPDGDVSPVAGVNSVVSALSGEVYVKLPAAARGVVKGFQPLKGIASVPIGSVLDTRKGRASVTTAADFRTAADPRHRTQTANLADGILRIKQPRKHRRNAPTRPFTDLVLASAAGAQAVCATRSRTSPIKGVVRRLAAKTKGRFRTVGGASTTTVTKGATFTITDRCTGTLTDVRRGRANVFDRRLRRTIAVKSGHTYLARATLFATKPGSGR